MLSLFTLIATKFSCSTPLFQLFIQLQAMLMNIMCFYKLKVNIASIICSEIAHNTPTLFFI